MICSAKCAIRLGLVTFNLELIIGRDAITTDAGTTEQLLPVAVYQYDFSFFIALVWAEEKNCRSCYDFWIWSVLIISYRLVHLQQQWRRQIWVPRFASRHSSPITSLQPIITHFLSSLSTSGTCQDVSLRARPRVQLCLTIVSSYRLGPPTTHEVVQGSSCALYLNISYSHRRRLMSFRFHDAVKSSYGSIFVARRCRRWLNGVTGQWPRQLCRVRDQYTKNVSQW